MPTADDPHHVWLDPALQAPVRLGFVDYRARSSDRRGLDRFAALDRAGAAEGRKIMRLTRLSPGFPFTLLNRAIGQVATLAVTEVVTRRARKARARRVPEPAPDPVQAGTDTVRYPRK